MIRFLRSVAPWLLPLLASGCASLYAAQTANTLGKGGLQVGVEPAVEYLGGYDGGGSRYLPRIDMAVRYGATDNIDVGGKVGGSFLELNAKFQLTDPANTGVVLSLAPSVGGLGLSAGGNSLGAFSFKLPLLIGFGFGDGNQVVFGPNVQDLVLYAGTNGTSTDVQNEVGVGASVGVAFRVSNSLRLMPAFGGMVPLVNAVDVLYPAGFYWQVGLTILWDVLGKNR